MQAILFVLATGIIASAAVGSIAVVSVDLWDLYRTRWRPRWRRRLRLVVASRRDGTHGVPP